MFEILPHTADFKVKFAGENFPALISSVFDFYFNQTIANNCDKNEIKETLKIEDEKFEFLVVRLINELIFYKEIGKLVKNFEIIEINENFLEINLFLSQCEFIEFKNDFKSATYHNLELKNSNNNYELTVVIDV